MIQQAASLLLLKLLLVHVKTKKKHTSTFSKDSICKWQKPIRAMTPHCRAGDLNLHWRPANCSGELGFIITTTVEKREPIFWRMYYLQPLHALFPSCVNRGAPGRANSFAVCSGSVADHFGTVGGAAGDSSEKKKRNCNVLLNFYVSCFL